MKPRSALRRPILLAGVVASLLSPLAQAAGPIPVPAEPRPDPRTELRADARFDLSVHQAPAAQVFLQLAQGTPWQMLVSPEIAGTLSLTLRDTTVLEAMEAIRDLHGYDFRVSGRRITVLPNTVQTRIFRVNHLPGRRQGTSDLRVTASSISQVGTQPATANAPAQAAASTAAAREGGSNQTPPPGGRVDDTAHVRTTSDNDFWRDVQMALQSLLGAADPSAPAGSPAAGRRSVVIHPGAGVVVVRATPAEMRLVAQYLEAVQLSVERQVMLEAKILEVELARDAQSGVNWSAFGRFLDGALSLIALAPGVTIDATGQLDIPAAASTLNTGRGFYGVAFRNTSFSTLLNFLETQGKVQVLSSPRIATINNQKAVLKVGNDELYVTGVSSSISSTGSATTSVPSVTLQPFFSGIALDVTPQIDAQGMVMLHVHPSISTVSEKQKTINLGSLGSYKLPLAASTVSETDSIVRVRDGQIVAIGGLMQQELRDDTAAVPGLGEAPVVGGLFRQKATVARKRELVILMKPTVIREDAAWPEPDTQAPRARIAPFPDDAR